MTALPERMVEAAARAGREQARQDGIDVCTWETLRIRAAAGNAEAAHRVAAELRSARAALTAALAVAEAEGAGLFVVPEERRFLSGEGEHVDSANAGAAGHNTCRAAILAGRVTL